jgi:hypothetical protein
MALTEMQIRGLKPKDKRYMIRDDNGLYLEVMTSGSKHWRYRYYDGKKEIKLSLGEYPYLGLKDAREKRDDLKRGMARGVDPKVTLRACLKTLICDINKWTKHTQMGEDQCAPVI